MRKSLIVVKLGGSTLTDKKRIFTPRMREIHRAARQIAELRRRFSVIVVHGAGSYGHIPVRKWRLESGLEGRHQVPGLALTKSKLLEWEMILDSVFLEHRVPLVPILASDFVVARNGRISSAELGPVRNWLSVHCVPSIGGDIVTDLKSGFSIVSGDQLASYLAVHLRASRLIFGVDVDGIFSDNPKYVAHARLLRVLTPGEALNAASKAGEMDAPDVTGGMAGKITEAVVAASMGVPVYFVNSTKDNRLAKASLERGFLGSKILPSK
jgi:isopentenyl phosphate kinase